jgi:primosomal protein N' (replication factor Y) (superfamily II helicase)
MAKIAHIALPVALYTNFDYLIPDEFLSKIKLGLRVLVSFGKRELVGIIVAISDNTTVPSEKLKSILQLLDDKAIVSDELYNLILWASNYYKAPLGMSFALALPSALLKPQKLKLKNKPKSGLNPIPNQALQLNPEQQAAVTAIMAKLDQFYPCLLDGVTGSGKTEVYLHIIQQVIINKKQVLVLVPEINLTPQMLARFQQRYAVEIGLIHSKMTPKQNLQTWLQAQSGELKIILGARSAIWTDFKALGLIIVDEEQDSSYKQTQQQLPYSARDIAVVRAQRCRIPLILGSATPSLETLYNAQQGRYHHYRLSKRAGCALPPKLHVVNMQQASKAAMRGQDNIGTNLSPDLQNEINTCLAKNQQVLLFINRRGYAPILRCNNCGWIAHCQHCDSNLIYHNSSHALHCHHCHTRQAMPLLCPSCNQAELMLLGQGTQRVEQSLQYYFPSAKILRIDSDSTRPKQALANFLEQIDTGQADILVGTQMLAKGHHFPNVTLVGIINLDGGLFGTDYRSSERMAQLFVQVSGRAGRAEQAGKVIVQTYYPEHPLLRNLINNGYHAFAQQQLVERQLAAYPPFNHLAMLRAQGTNIDKLSDFLAVAYVEGQHLLAPGLQLYQPTQAIKRANKYHANLLIKATNRALLQDFLRQWLIKLIQLIQLNPYNISWLIDVDPIDL